MKADIRGFDVDPQLQALGLQLANVAVRNTAGAVADRVTAAKARRKNEETIAELEEIVSGLIADKSELVRIAQAFEEELVAQRIADDDVEYITTNILPVLTKLAESQADVEEVQEFLEIVQPILKPETLTVLQLLGFNFRRAVGEPLTQLLRSLILAQAPSGPEAGEELQKLSLQREVAYLELARDPEAFERLRELQ